MFLNWSMLLEIFNLSGILQLFVSSSSNKLRNFADGNSAKLVCSKCFCRQLAKLGSPHFCYFSFEFSLKKYFLRVSHEKNSSTKNEENYFLNRIFQVFLNLRKLKEAQC